MADEIKQEILIDINLEQDEGDFKKLADLKGALNNVIAEKKKLLQALKEGQITQKEYNSEVVRAEAVQKKLQSEYNKTQREVTGLKNPLEEINNSLQKQTALLSGAVPGLDKLTGGAASAATGIFSMVKASLAFIATPIGAIIAALGLAVAALTAYFKGSEEGQNRLNKIVAVGSAIFEQFQNVLEFVGKKIFEAFNNPKQAIIDFANLVKNNIINRFEGFLELIPQLGKAIGLLFKGEFTEAGKVAFDAVAKVATGIENASGKIQGFIEETVKLVDEGIKAGKRLAAFQALIDLEERRLITERARVSLEVSKLRSRAVEEEGDIKRKTIEEAIKLETDLSDKELELAKVREAQAKLIVKTNGDTKEALNDVAKATAVVSQAEQTRFDNTLKFRKQLEALEEEEEKKKKEKEEEQRKADEKAFDDLLAKEAKDQKAKEDQDNKIAKNRKDREKQRLNEAQQSIENLDKVFKKSTVAGKALAVGQATVNTYLGATEILKQKSTLPSPFDFITKAINFAATIAAGLGAVKSITGVGFARGGYTGRGGMWDPAGIVHRGEVVWSQADVHAAGGPEAVDRMRPTYQKNLAPYAAGGIVGNETRLATVRAQSQFDLNEMARLINQVQTVLVLEQFQAKQAEVDGIERRATVISR